jgi:hypothetical protein
MDTASTLRKGKLPPTPLGAPALISSRACAYLERAEPLQHSQDR